MSKHKPQKNRAERTREPGSRTFLQRPSECLVSAILVLGCFALFLPLVVNYEYYYPHVFLKSILFRVAVELMIFLYVVLAILSPAHRPRLHRIFYALFAYFGVMLFCSIPGISINAWNSWWGDFTRMGGMFSQLHRLAYFFVLSQTLKREREWLTLFGASLFFGVLMGFSGLVQYLNLDFIFHLNIGDRRIYGATGNAVYFASYMLLNFFIAFHFLSRRDRSETYPVIAKTWLVLLFSLDLLIIVLNIATEQPILSAAVSTIPVVLFALLLHAITFLWFWMRRNARIGTCLLVLLELFYLFWMYESQTRAAVLGLLGSLVFMSILYAFSGSGKKLKYAAASSILLVIVAGTVLSMTRHSGFVKNHTLLARLTSSSLEENRFLAWKASVSGIMDHPIAGWGLENYNKAFDLHAPAQLFGGATPENWFDRAHNIVLDVGTMAGSLGLITYLAFYILIFSFLLSYWFRSKDAARALCIAGLIAAYLLQNIFSFDTLNTDVILFLLLAYIAYSYTREHSEPQPEAAEYPLAHLGSGNNLVALVITAAVLACAGWYLVIRPRESNLLLQQGIGLEQIENPQSNTRSYVLRQDLLDRFQEADRIGTTGRYQVRQEFANYASELVGSNLPQEDKARVARMAINLLEKSLSEDPQDARHYMYEASLVNRAFGTLKQSDPSFAASLAERNLSLLQKAELLGPNRPQLFLDRAQSLIYLGRTAESIPALQKAIALSPALAAPRVDLAAVYISLERYGEAEREWQRIRSLSLPLSDADYSRIRSTFAAKKQFGSVVNRYKEQLQASPDNGLLLSRLAAAYREAGDMEAAKSTAYRAAALSPQVAAQLEDFLKSLGQAK